MSTRQRSLSCICTVHGAQTQAEFYTQGVLVHAITEHPFNTLPITAGALPSSVPPNPLSLHFLARVCVPPIMRDLFY